MSLLVVDHYANIQRLISILKADTTNLFNSANPKNKLRKIFFAETPYDLNDDSTPYVFVQIADELQFTNDQLGTSNPEFLQAIAVYNVVLVVQKKDVATTQKEIFRFLPLIVDQLKLYPTLDDPANPGNPIAVRSNMMSITRLEPVHGKEKDGVVIKLKIQFGSAWTLQLPAPIGTVNVISVQTYTDTNDVDIDLDDSAVQEITAKAMPSKIAVEFESNGTIDGQLKTIKDADDIITITLAKGTTSRVRTCKLTGISKPVPYDTIEHTLAVFDVIQ